MSNTANRIITKFTKGTNNKNFVPILMLLSFCFLITVYLYTLNDPIKTNRIRTSKIIKVNTLLANAIMVVRKTLNDRMAKRINKLTIEISVSVVVIW